MSSNVYVTGIGIVSPAGNNRESTWQSLLSGHLHVKALENVDLSGCRTNFAAQVRNFPDLENKYHGDRVCRLAFAAAEQAIQNAGFAEDLIPNERMAVSIGTSKGGIFAFSDFLQYWQGGRSLDSSLLDTLSAIPPDGPARAIARKFGIMAGIHAPVSACSTGLQAIIGGANMITDGRADVVIAGSADASIHPLWVSAFEKMNVLAKPHPERGTAWACRPFDKNRNGFALGEGAAILVLESEESVTRRGIEPWVRLSGWALGSDPAGLTRLSADASPLSNVIQLACSRAFCHPDMITAHVAHGTATPDNDPYETRAMARLLGRKIPPIPVISIKGSCGHLLGGAGSVETAVAGMAAHFGQLPGNASLLDLDPRLPDFLYPSQSITLQRGPILKTALGFGGHLAALIIEPAY
jgi:3-oxoacyl-(acyl-carrier-protein) synthase